MGAFNRGKAVGVQTPAYAQTVVTEADSLRNQAENAGLLGISPAVDKFFIPQGDDQVHHVSGLRVLDGIYAHTTPEQRQELQSMVPSGHSMLNFMLMPQAVHQGLEKGADSIHNYLRANGLEVSGKIDPNTFIGRTEAVRDGSYEQKKALMAEYAKDVLPGIRNKMDDLLTDYYTSGKRKAMEELSINPKAVAIMTS